jgi:DNA (cytosine-5)-methyltransferase 1
MEGAMSSSARLKIAGLFAGVGGIEQGLHEAGHASALLCEIDPGARRVLESRFPGVPLEPDVTQIQKLPAVDVLAAGFPCQDLSQAGKTAGIRGKQSGLVQHVFRLLRKTKPKWLLIENVSFMLQLDRGRAMKHLVDELESQSYGWAYRVVDTLAFGLPQRRQRVILVASRTEDPRSVLFADDAGGEDRLYSPGILCGFYWTEGTRGLGWAVDAVPTLKGGSTIGIPSPPAIWDEVNSRITTPDIRDAERLQGFEADWTLPAVEVKGVRNSHRWKLVGNAVSVPVARWIGERLGKPGHSLNHTNLRLASGGAWPRAAWGRNGESFKADVSMWPVRTRREHLANFLMFPQRDLSERASAGFLSRADGSSLSFHPSFLETVRQHVNRMRSTAICREPRPRYLAAAL